MKRQGWHGRDRVGPLRGWSTAGLLIALGCGDLPAEAVGPPELSNTTSGTSGSTGDPDRGDTTPATTLDDGSTSGSTGPDGGSSTRTGDGGPTSTDDGESSGSEDTGPVLPACGDGVVAPGELCHELGPVVMLPSAPSRVVVADLDKDGALDVLSSTLNLPDVQVLWGVGDGNFVAPQLLLVADAIVDDLVVADLSGDTWPDLVLTDRTGSRVVTYAGDGAGDLFFAGLYPVGLQPYRLAIGDLDADGTPDIVAMGSGSASVMMGNGLAGFIPQQFLTVPSGPYSAGLFDLDLDADLDLLTVNQGGGNTSCFLRGLGSFGSGTDHDTASSPQGMAVGDVDQDGALDLLVVHASGDDVGMLLGDGVGALGPESSSMLADDPRAVAVADFDLDGHLDMAVAHTAPGLVILHKGMGDGTFAEGPSFEVTAVTDLTVADLNADGVADLVLSQANGSSIRTLLSTP